jgi:hypothetical protein
MEHYLNNYDSFNKQFIYDFKVGSGGIGDCILFFMLILESCIKNNIGFYYKKNNIEIEKYIKLKHDKMYIDEDTIQRLNCSQIVTPDMYYYSTTNYYDYSIDVKDVFYFSDEVKHHCNNIFPSDITNYISIHVRLGDKHLETNQEYVNCKEDVRTFSEEKIYKFIEENSNKHIYFCCDNNSYKLKIKEKYNHLIITNVTIGHISLSNTTNEQVLDAVTEFYILTNSEMIFGASKSGFSILASKFNNVPLIS